jgi:polyisoprenoid-binding protein YceI
VPQPAPTTPYPKMTSNSLLRSLSRFLAGAAVFAAGALAYRVAMPPEEPKREAPPPPRPDRTGEVLDEIANVQETLKAFAAAVDAAAEERQQLSTTLSATRSEGAQGAKDLRRALQEIREQVTAVSRRQDDLALALAAKAQVADPVPPAAAAATARVPEPAPEPAVEAKATAPAPEPEPAPAAAPEAPTIPKRKSLAELLAERKRVDPRDRLTRYRLVDGYCNVGFDGVSTLHNFTGQSKKVAGEFQLHLNDLGDHPSGKLLLPPDTLDTGNEKRDADMRDSLGSDVISCELLSFDKKNARVRFTIHGTSNEVTTPLELTFDKGLLHVKGEAKLKMSDFGVKVKSAAFGMVTMDDEVTIWWDLYAEALRDAPH